MRLAVEPRSPSRGRAQVFVAEVASLTTSIEASCEAALSEDERARCQRFLFERDRRSYRLSHALLRHVLSWCEPRAPSSWTFVEGEHGRPEIARGTAATGLRFSLSHTEGAAVVAVTTEDDLGVDIERVRTTVSMTEIASAAFTPDERRELDALSGAVRWSRFFEQWTLKESYIKAIGTGLSTDPSRVGFRRAGDRAVPIFDRALRDDESAWTFAQPDVGPGYAVAVAIRAPRAQIVVHRDPWGVAPATKVA
jgi:4'-phosphopantetheinyl transferase